MRIMVWLAVGMMGWTVPPVRAEEALSAPPAAEATDITIDKMTVGTAIESRQLVGESAVFDASIKRVYCWTLVTARQTPATLRHVWYADNKVLSDVVLNIHFPTTRTWSYKTVWPGHWKVQAVDEAGQILSTVAFTVKEETKNP